ncbi:MAG: TetR/AcrR family transcriptional regulator [Balneolales bacterium]|nr:TetR/AcrR family transcriptional regulator [Balneolales bacterium]
MGILERKEREKAQKRASIIESAEALILEKGLDQLNMDQVAERSEISKGTVYLYFKNKTDLVLAICDKASTLMNEKTSKVLTQNITGLQMVYQMGINFIEFVSEHPEYNRAIRFMDNFRNTEQVLTSEYMGACIQNRQESFRAMVRAIQIGMQDGSINDTYDPNQLALLLWATSHGVKDVAYMHQNADHFNLLDNLGIDLTTMFKGYMKLIGEGIKGTNKTNGDFESFFETQIQLERSERPD